eukprot:SAG31_NODE_41762_length_274_cov_1.171429_1_plen_45_part_10
MAYSGVSGEHGPDRHRRSAVVVVALLVACAAFGALLGPRTTALLH